MMVNHNKITAPYEEAFAVYKEAKELHIKSLAEKWKNDLDPRVYKALMNYVVEITD